ncbi:MAG: type II secretion system protein [Thermodesulfobacteriota bacterium]
MSGRIEKGKPSLHASRAGRGFQAGTRRCETGFTYISALILIAVSSIALTEAGRVWQLTAKREREEELLFRGDQIRRAIASYAGVGGSGGAAYPTRLEELLKDPRFPGTKRHLRKLYRDPLTRNGQWALISNTGAGISGVCSRSRGVPLKTGNFPSIYQKFEKARRYSDWKFVHIPMQLQQTAKTGPTIPP